MQAQTIRVQQGMNRLPEIPGWPVARVIKLSDRARRQFEGLAQAEQLARQLGRIPLAVRIMLPGTRWAQSANEQCIREILAALPLEHVTEVQRMTNLAMEHYTVT